MPSYRKGILLQHDSQWYVRDDQDGNEAQVSQEQLSGLGGEAEADATVEYTRQPVDKKSATLIVKELQLTGDTPLLPTPVGRTIPAGFVNPYNFVPLTGHVSRSAPVSHEYFRGYSGNLTCSLTFKTPFFTPDSAGADKNQDGHEKLKLLKDTQGHGIIPGSALKGVIRSLAEVISSSCLSVVDLEARFSWRNVNDKGWRGYWRERPGHWGKLQPGVVEALPEEGQPGKIAPATSAKIYFDNLPKDSKDGDEATADIVTTPKGHLKAINVKLGHTGSGEHGYLKVTEVPENNEERRTQRFVYAIESDQTKWHLFDEAVVRGYNQTTEASRDLDARRRKDFQPPDYDFTSVDSSLDSTDASRGLRRKRHRLEVGDIVYFVSSPKKEVVRLGPVELSRVLYKQGVAQGIPEAFQPCRDPQKLCPCCRLFGWVPPSRREREREDEEARAGFISISLARTEKKLTSADILEANATLRPLGQPHASAMNFYLQQPGDALKAGHYDKPPFEIRGRKFYWHRAESRAAYTDTRDGGQPKPDNQNKTAELLRAGTVFHFQIAFENLSAAQLGLLLVAVQPSLLGAHSFYHKIGMGKPLGLGSAEVRITGVELIQRAQRYNSLWETGLERPSRIKQWAASFADAFVRQMLEDQQREVPLDLQQARQAFAQLPHIEPLLWMLDWKQKPSGVSYPPGPSDAVEESFRWFMEFKDDPEKGRLLTPQEIIGTAAQPKRQFPYPENS